MKKLLIIALLVAGCDNSTEAENNSQDVAWLIADGDFYYIYGGSEIEKYPIVYWTNGYKPERIVHSSSAPVSIGIFFIIQNDTAFASDSVKSIKHFTQEGYFKIDELYSSENGLYMPVVYGNYPDTIINFSNDEVFKYEYK